MHFPVHRLNRCRFLAQRVGDRGDGNRGRERFLNLPRLAADAECTHLYTGGTVWSRFGRIYERESDASHHLLEKFLVLFARDTGLQLDALNAGLRQTGSPFPVAELAQSAVLVDRLLPKEREPRVGVMLLQIAEALIGSIDRAFARGMTVVVESH